MRIHQPWHKSVIRAHHAFSGLESRIELPSRADRDNPPIRDRDGMVLQDCIDRRNRQHPAGFENQIDGLLRLHARMWRQEKVFAVYRVIETAIGDGSGTPVC
jgi:hypothetical protein